MLSTCLSVIGQRRILFQLHSPSRNSSHFGPPFQEVLTVLIKDKKQVSFDPLGWELPATLHLSFIQFCGGLPECAPSKRASKGLWQHPCSSAHSWRQSRARGRREGGGEPATYILQDTNGIRQVPNVPLFPHTAEPQTKKIKATSKNNYWAKSCFPTGRYLSSHIQNTSVWWLEGSVGSNLGLPFIIWVNSTKLPRCFLICKIRGIAVLATKNCEINMESI